MKYKKDPCPSLFDTLFDYGEGGGGLVKFGGGGGGGWHNKF